MPRLDQVIWLNSSKYRQTIDRFSTAITQYKYGLKLDIYTPIIATISLFKMTPILVAKKLDHKFGTMCKGDYFAIADSTIVLPSLLMKTIYKISIAAGLIDDTHPRSPIKRMSTSVISDIIKDLNTPTFSMFYCRYNNVYSTVNSLEIRGHDITLEHSLNNYGDNQVILLMEPMIIKAKNPFPGYMGDVYYQIHKDYFRPIKRILKNKDLQLDKWNTPDIHKLYSRASEIRDVLKQIKSSTEEMITEARLLDRRLNRDEDLPF